MNCKPGDLAIIVKPRVSDHNIGKIVRCLFLRTPLNGNPNWEVEYQGCLGLTSRGMLRRAGCEDHRLLPISGLPESADVRNDSRSPHESHFPQK